MRSLPLCEFSLISILKTWLSELLLHIYVYLWSGEHALGISHQWLFTILHSKTVVCRLISMIFIALQTFSHHHNDDCVMLLSNFWIVGSVPSRKRDFALNWYAKKKTLYFRKMFRRLKDVAEDDPTMSDAEDGSGQIQTRDVAPFIGLVLNEMNQIYIFVTCA